MHGSRIPLLDDARAEAAAERAGVPQYVTVLNLNRALLHHPTMARRFVEYFWDLMYENVLDPRLRELAILRTAWLTGSVYEWTQHWPLAEGVGIPQTDRLAVRRWEEHEAWSPADRAVLAATDDVVLRGAVSGTAWKALEESLGADPASLVEVVLALTGWRMVASVLQSLDVPLEEGMRPWPPDGVGPATGELP